LQVVSPDGVLRTVRLWSTTAGGVQAAESFLILPPSTARLVMNNNDATTKAINYALVPDAFRVG
jgi:hypothetical protein